MGYTRGRTVVHAMSHIRQTKTNLAKPSATQQLTIIWKGSETLDLVFIDIYPWQDWFWWFQGRTLLIASHITSAGKMIMIQ